MPRAFTLPEDAPRITAPLDASDAGSDPTDMDGDLFARAGLGLAVRHGGRWRRLEPTAAAAAGIELPYDLAADAPHGAEVRAADGETYVRVGRRWRRGNALAPTPALAEGLAHLPPSKGGR